MVMAKDYDKFKCKECNSKGMQRKRISKQLLSEKLRKNCKNNIEYLQDFIDFYQEKFNGTNLIEEK